jgi:hypothetical protein
MIAALRTYTSARVSAVLGVLGVAAPVLTAFLIATVR